MARARIVAVAVCLGLGGTQAYAQNPGDFINKRFSSVTVVKDIPYADVFQTNYSTGAVTYVTLALDLYQPTGDSSTNRPVIIWIHGGGFRRDSYKTQSYIVNYANEFAKRGYVCVSIEYRRRFATGDGHADADVPGTPEYPALHDATRDARYAIDWIRTNASTYRINPGLIFIAGGSAGGRITQTVSQVPGPDTAAVYSPDTLFQTAWSKVGLIANATLWGGLEVPMRGWTYPFLVAPKILPTVLVHGTADTTIDPQNSIDLSNAITSAGGTAELHLISGAGHTPTSYDSSIIPWVANFFASEWTKSLASPPANEPPLIIAPPQSVTVSAGASVTFSVTATGTAPLAYQWRKYNGSVFQNIDGATGSTYSLTADTTSSYDVVVTNPYGTATSTAATLTVAAAGAAGRLVIAEVYPGGGKTGASYKQDFVVLRNIGGAPVSLSNWSLQHDKGGVWQTPFVLPTATIPAGGYYLIKAYNDGSTASGTASLPTADATTPQSSAWNFSTTTRDAVALVMSTTKLTACSGASIADLVGYVSTSGNCYETGLAPTGSATKSLRRNGQDTNNNAADFALGAPTPRNSATPP